MTPDYKQAALYCDALDPTGGPHMFVGLRGKVVREAYMTLDEAWPDILAWVNQGLNVFIAPNAMDGRGRKAHNVTQMRAIWQELDTAEHVNTPLPLLPTLDVQTSEGKRHRLWVVENTRDLDKGAHADLMARMVQDHNSDPRATDTARLLRLPGTLNYKYDTPQPVKLLSVGSRHSMAAVRTAFPRMPREIVVTHDPVGDPPDIVEAQCILDALAVIPADDYGTWLSVGMALHHRYSADPEGLSIWDAWSQQSKAYVSGECDYKWGTFDPTGRDRRNTVGTIYGLATKVGYDGPTYAALQRDAALTDGLSLIEAPAAPRAMRLEMPREISLEDAARDQSNSLIKYYFERGTVGVLYGDPGAGKTFLALDMAWHIAQGRRYGPDKLQVKKAPVLYCALEGVSGLRKRVMAIRQGLGDTGDYFARHVVRRADLNDFTLAVSDNDKQSDRGRRGVAELVEAAKDLTRLAGESVGLIVIDTLAQSMGGANENDAAMMQRFCTDRAAKIAAETGAAVLIVHHSGKSGDMRGSSALRAAADFIFKCERRGNDRVLLAEKIKDGEEGKVFDFRLAPVTLGLDLDQDPITSCVVEIVAADAADAAFTDLVACAIEGELAMGARLAVAITAPRHNTIKAVKKALQLKDGIEPKIRGAIKVLAETGRIVATEAGRSKFWAMADTVTAS